MATTELFAGPVMSGGRDTRGAWRRAASSPLGIVALSAMSLVLFLTIAGPWIWGDAARHKDLNSLNTGPSAKHLFGTDNLGRDILARVLVATRLSVGLTLTTVALAFVIGVTLGTVPATLGPRVRRFSQAITGMLVAFPPLLLALFCASIFGTGAHGAVLALTVAIAPSVTRLTQTLTASMLERDFVAAAKVMGIGRVRIILRHVLPNIAANLVVNLTLFASGLLLAFSSLSFLTLGVQPPSYDWGQLMSNGLSNIYVNPMAALAPGLAVLLAGLAFNLCGEAAARVFAGQAGPSNEKRARRAEATVQPYSTEATRGVLEVEDLWVTVSDGVAPVRGVSFSLAAGESIGFAGESGAGKSLTAMAIARLLKDPVTVTAGRLEFLGHSEIGAEDAAQRSRLGTTLSVVFQDPLSSLNPTMRVGKQLAEVSREHTSQTRLQRSARAVDRLRAVRIPQARRRARQYPHEFSGGMRQRVMIAMGLMGEPKLIIADEPTTALDVTVQRQVLTVIKDIQRDTGCALILISHDLAVISQTCDRVIIMYGGRMVEELPVADLRSRAVHPYTRALIDAIPDLDSPRGQRLATIEGLPPRPAEIPAGCAFAPRCPFADEACQQLPPLVPISAGAAHRAACWHPIPQIQESA